MKKLIILIVLFLVAFDGQSQEYKDEISVVFFTASFAKTKEIENWKKLYDCNKHILNIEDQPDLMSEESISVVPTIKIFNNGKEIKVWQANIMFELDISVKDIQKEINKIVESKFN